LPPRPRRTSIRIVGFKIGAALGFGIGYYLGAKAGKERAAQIERFVRRVQQSDFGETAADKARAVIDLTVERARGTIAAAEH